MAKSNTFWVDAAQVGSDDPENQNGTRTFSFGNPFGEFPRLFHKDGWRESQTHAGCIAATPEKNEAVKAWRKKQIDWFFKSTDKFPAYEFTNKDGVEETRYMSGPEIGQHMRNRVTNKDGSFKDVKWINLTGNRRVSAIFASELAYCLHHNDMSLRLEIPCFEAKVSTDEQIAVLRANENDPEGKREYTKAERFAIAFQFVKDFGYKEAQLSHVGFPKRGERQKWHRLATLAMAHPQVRIRERAMMPVPLDPKGKPDKTYTKGGWFNVESCDASEVHGLLGKAAVGEDEPTKRMEAIKPRVCAAFAVGLDAAGKESIIGVEANDEQIEKYIELTFEKAPETGDKMLDTASVKGLRDRSVAESDTRKLLTALISNDNAGAQQALNAISKQDELVTQLTAEVATLKGQVKDLESDKVSLTKQLEKAKGSVKSSK